LAIYLKSSGRPFHKRAAVYLKEFLPYIVVFNLSISTILEYLKLYLLFLKQLNHLNMVVPVYTIF
jgi:hypothetical protein